MAQEARALLEAAVADLTEITRKLQRILPGTQGKLRNDLLQIQSQSETAIRYYTSILARDSRGKTPAVAQTVGLAAFGAGFIGLVPREFAVPRGASEGTQ